MLTPASDDNFTQNPLQHIQTRDLNKALVDSIIAELSQSQTKDSLEHIRVSSLDESTALNLITAATAIAESEVIRRNEKTHAELLAWLVKSFSLSLGLSFVLICLAIINPKVDKTFVKESLPLIIAPQVTLLGGGYGAFCLRPAFRRNKSKNKY